MRIGLVSNVWAALLPHTPLQTLCAAAAARAYEYVELRQGALGECEATARGPGGSALPIPSSLERLASSVPELDFNLAVEAPFLSRRVPPDAYIARCAEAAAALGGEPPVLRLVDPTPAPALLDREEALEELAEALAELSASVWEQARVRLALENSRQPVRPLLEVMRRARTALGDGVPAPQLCWDPANQVQQTLLVEDPLELALSLPLAELFEFHFKQIRQERPLPQVTEGDLDWSALLEPLATRGFAGPALFEIPPRDDAWDRLDRSRQFIASILGRLGRESRARQG
jgi:sugar phosphate isomerase/epimerase